MNPLHVYGQIQQLGNNQQKKLNSHRQTYKSNRNLYQQKINADIEENKKVEDELNTELNILREELAQLEKEFDSNKSKIIDKIKELEDALTDLKVEEEKMKKHYNQLKEKSKNNMIQAIKKSKNNYPNQVLNARRQLGLNRSLPPKMHNRGSATPRNSRRNSTRKSSSLKPKWQKPRSGIRL
jgi:DNA repair exonuclease SbcCD ATPase subunit